jgi:anti-sigma B factor antagonist
MADLSSLWRQESPTTMSEDSFTVTIRHIKDVTLIDVKGRLIMGEPVDTLTEKIQGLFEQGKKYLAVNLAGVTYVDSTGIAVMADATTGAKEAGGECKFYAATSRVLQLLRVTHLDTAFIILADEDSALSSF